MGLAEAKRVKMAIKIKLGKPPWLRGIGVGANDAGEHCVKINVDKVTPEIQKLAGELATEFSADIKIEEVGNIVTLDK